MATEGGLYASLCCELGDEIIPDDNIYKVKYLTKEKLKESIRKIKYVSCTSYVQLPLESEIIIEDFYNTYNLIPKSSCFGNKVHGFQYLFCLSVFVFVSAVSLIILHWQLFSSNQLLYEYDQQLKRYFSWHIFTFFENSYNLYGCCQILITIAFFFSFFFGQYDLKYRISALCKFMTKLAQEEYISETKMKLENDFQIFIRLFLRFYEQRILNEEIKRAITVDEVSKVKSGLLVKIDEYEPKIDFNAKFLPKRNDCHDGSIKSIIEERIQCSCGCITLFLFVIPWIIYTLLSFYLLYTLTDLYLFHGSNVELGISTDELLSDKNSIVKAHGFQYIVSSIVLNTLGAIYLYAVMNYSFNIFLLKILYPRIRTAIIIFCHRLVNEVWNESVVNGIVGYLVHGKSFSYSNCDDDIKVELENMSRSQRENQFTHSLGLIKDDLLKEKSNKDNVYGDGSLDY